MGDCGGGFPVITALCHPTPALCPVPRSGVLVSWCSNQLSPLIPLTHSGLSETSNGDDCRALRRAYGPCARQSRTQHGLPLDPPGCDS
ncbi:unnamed protein product [Merluccius merluccius]